MMTTVFCLWKKLVVKDIVFVSPLCLFAGLAGFFPLHPMMITEAERRRALTELTATGAEDGLQEGQNVA